MLDGLIWTTAAAITHMTAAGHGAIDNMSSAASKQVIGHVTSYTASKGAMNALTRSIAVDYGPDNVDGGLLAKMSIISIESADYETVNAAG